MVKIRLTRTGKKHEPHYRIVAADSHSPRDGKYIERIGYYNPRTKPPTLNFDKEKLQKWLDNGAQMTDTVNDIFVREGIVKQSPKRKKQIELKIERSKNMKKEKTKEDTGSGKPKVSTKDKPEEKPKTKESKATEPESAKEDQKSPKKKEDKTKIEKKTQKKKQSSKETPEKLAKEGQPEEQSKVSEKK